MAFLAVSLWSGLLVWAALKTAASLRASCLSGKQEKTTCTQISLTVCSLLVASSSPADKISITECTNESLNFTWSIHISTEDLALVKFEYSCINASSVTVSCAIKLIKDIVRMNEIIKLCALYVMIIMHGPPQIIKNETILNNDGPTGAGNAMFTPVSGATCLISACYTDSGNNFHYITPTGCTASPSTLQKGGRSEIWTYTCIGLILVIYMSVIYIGPHMHTHTCMQIQQPSRRLT